MAAPSRTAQLSDFYKALKKHYKPVATDFNRSFLEHLIFAGILENASYDVAQQAYASLHEEFFDYNEIRVTSVSELSEVMRMLPDPQAAASRVKRMLQAIFEESYAFDLEAKKRGNLGPTIEWLEKLDGSSKFTVSYLIQSALAGHSIPVDEGVVKVLRLLNLITDAEVESGIVQGIERAIAKSKGVEFGSILHQLGAAFYSNPYSTNLKKILVALDPTVKERLPKRRTKKEAAAPQKDEAPEKEETSTKAKGKDEGVQEAAKKTSKKKPAEKKAEPKKAIAKKKVAKKTVAKKAVAKKKVAKKAVAKKAAKKAATKKVAKKAAPKKAAKKTVAKKATPVKKKKKTGKATPAKKTTKKKVAKKTTKKKVTRKGTKISKKKPR